MPTYDYECTSCGTVREVFHGMSEAPEISCAECGKPSVKKIGGGNGLIFKGSGFYVTDYKGGGKKESCAAGGCSGSCPN